MVESQRAGEGEEIDDEFQPDSQETEDAPATPPDGPDDATPHYHYQPLDFKTLEKLKVAVSNYNPTAPFTLALLESSTEGWLMPR